MVFAPQMMKGRATRRWDSSSNLMTNQEIPIHSEHFKTTFLDKYFPNSLRTQKEFEFQQLRQGIMSVTKFVEKFENMVVYFRKIVYALNEKWNVNQFMFGLRVEITHNVYQREFITYAELLRQCYIAEDSLKRV